MGLPDPKEFHRHLGDGVYASFDGYHIWLRTGSHDSEENKIALEPAVLKALLAYRADIPTMVIARKKAAEENDGRS